MVFEIGPHLEAVLWGIAGLPVAFYAARLAFMVACAMLGFIESE